MTDETLLFYAKQIKKHCELQGECNGCVFVDRVNCCILSSVMSYFPPCNWYLPAENNTMKYKVYKTVMDYDKDECYDIEYDGVLYDSYEEANEVLKTLNAGVIKTVFTKYQKGAKK